MYKSNLLPSIPETYANFKENRSLVETILGLIEYHSHGWQIMCDLKVLNLIMGLKSGYVKSLTVCLIPDKVCLILIPFIYVLFVWNLIKSFWYPLARFHFLFSTLDLFQRFAKGLDKGYYCFKFICQNIKKLEVKLSNGVFNGTEIRLLMALKNFPEKVRERAYSLVDFLRCCLARTGKGCGERLEVKSWFINVSLLSYRMSECYKLKALVV